jgi:hypothetical protein
MENANPALLYKAHAAIVFIAIDVSATSLCQVTLRAVPD